MSRHHAPMKRSLLWKTGKEYVSSASFTKTRAYTPNPNRTDWQDSFQQTDRCKTPPAQDFFRSQSRPESPVDSVTGARRTKTTLDSSVFSGRRALLDNQEFQDGDRVTFEGKSFFFLE